MKTKIQNFSKISLFTIVFVVFSHISFAQTANKKKSEKIKEPTIENRQQNSNQHHTPMPVRFIGEEVNNPINQNKLESNESNSPKTEENSMELNKPKIDSDKESTKPNKK